MKQSYGHIKWVSNHKYFIYLVRELTSVPLAIFGIYLLIDFAVKNEPSTTSLTQTLTPLLNIPEQYITPILYIGLTGAIIHAITWFHTLPKILPFTSTKIREKIAGIIILAIWIIFSYATYQYLYK